MSYITLRVNMVDSEGSLNAPIAFVGEAPSYEEVKKGRPFSGPAGSILDFCLQSANIIRSDCYITNLFKKPVSKRKDGNKELIILDGQVVWNGKYFTEAGKVWVEQLHQELNDFTGNIIVPLGNPALTAITGLVGILNYRGYVTSADILGTPHKVLPSLHPATAIHGDYINRYTIARDFKKARLESESPDLHYDPRNLYIPTTFEEACSLLDGLKQYNKLAVDIETLNHEVACIGFAWSPLEGISIPLNHMWTLEQEVELWIKIASVLENPEVSKIFQNGIFDIQVLFFRNHILTQGVIEDTMIEHSVVYPEFPKSLLFLGSIYTNQPHWKGMVKFKHTKKDS